MGEVYRARDTRLGRDVALKILPEPGGLDAERLQRFELEARAVAALNHPNIMGIFDVGTHEGIPYLISELLEGETIGHLLHRSALPVRKAIDYSVQIASGLAAAHDKGIVHRDLKPENLFVTREGRVKILDFGLARLAQAKSPAGSDGTTADLAVTEVGRKMGTASYMSPEQVKGNIADYRSDIFSFGLVLYEMLSGHRAFRRETTAETMAAILKEEPPDLANGGLHLPPSLYRIVCRCVEKNPAQRFQSARDLGFALDNIDLSSSSHGEAATESFREKHRIGNWKTATLAALVLALAAGWLALRGWLAHPTPPLYTQVTFRKGYIRTARFAADGQTIIYAAAWDKPALMLYSTRVSGADRRNLEISSGDILAVSRTGEMAVALDRALARLWTTPGRLATLPAGGGEPHELLEGVIDADWAPDGSHLAISRVMNGRVRLEYPIGRVLYETNGYVSHLRFSPQGDVIAFMDHPFYGDDRGAVAIIDLKGNKKDLTREWVAEQGLAWSPNGREIWFTAADRFDRALYAVTRSGRQRTVLTAPGSLLIEDVAADGRVLLTGEDFRGEVVTGDTQSGQSRQLTWLQYMDVEDVSRDGKLMLLNDYASMLSGADYALYVAKPDGTPGVLVGMGMGGGISPDNKWVTSILPSDPSKVQLLPTGIGEPRIVTAGGFSYHHAWPASDGKRLIVSASEAGRPPRMWVQDIDGQKPRPLTGEGVTGKLVNVSHTDFVAARDATGLYRLYPVDGSEARSIPGLTSADRVIGGSLTQSVYVVPQDATTPVPVVKLDLISGERRPFVTIAANDAAGIIGSRDLVFSGNEKIYVKTYYRAISVLYVVSGLK